MCEHYCSLRVGKVVGTCLAAAASQLLWYEAHDAVRRQGLRYLSADITGPALPLTINSTIVTIVFGLLLALALDTLLQYASHALHCTALYAQQGLCICRVSVCPSVCLSVCLSHAAASRRCGGQCSRKRVQQLKKRKKSCFLDFEKNVQKTQKRTYSFRGHLITPRPLIHSYRKSVALSRQHQTCLLGRSVHIHKKLSNLELCVINVY